MKMVIHSISGGLSIELSQNLTFVASITLKDLGNDDLFISTQIIDPIKEVDEMPKMHFN